MEVPPTPHTDQTRQIDRGSESVETWPDSIEKRLDYLEQKIPLSHEVRSELENILAKSAGKTIDAALLPPSLLKDFPLLKTLVQFLGIEKRLPWTLRLRLNVTSGDFSQHSLTLEYIIERAFPLNKEVTVLYPGCGLDSEEFLSNLDSHRITSVILNTLDDLDGGKRAEAKAKTNGIENVTRHVGDFTKLTQTLRGTADVLLLTSLGGGVVFEADYISTMKEGGIIVAGRIPYNYISSDKRLTTVGTVSDMHILKVRETTPFRS